MPKDFTQVGTVEILRARTYAIDPMNKDILATEAVVMPGSFPLMSDGYTYLWLMTGVLNGNSMRRGDGMFVMGNSDMPIDGLTVTFPSPSFGPSEWKDMINDPVATEGHPEQRLRITINKETA
jgi:hypothetical protein